MSRAALLARARAAAEAGMVDTCHIRRRTGESTTNDVTGVVTPAYGPDVYTGPCRVQQRRETSSQETDVGEDQAVLLTLEVQLPMTVTGLADGDEITVLTSATDPDLPGRTFLITSLGHKTDASARRVKVTERTDR